MRVGEIMTSEIAEVQKVDHLMEALRRATTKQKSLILNILFNSGDKTLRQACIDAGYSLTENARHSRIIDQLDGKLPGLKFYITEDDLVAKINQLFNAKRQIVAKIPEYDDGGKVCGLRIEFVEVEDNPTQMRMTEILLKLGGYFPAIQLKLKTKGKIDHEHSLKSANAPLLQARRKAIEGRYDEIDDDGNDENHGNDENQ
jgi:hypothetical protein